MPPGQNAPYPPQICHTNLLLINSNRGWDINPIRVNLHRDIHPSKAVSPRCLFINLTNNNNTGIPRVIKCQIRNNNKE